LNTSNCWTTKKPRALQKAALGETIANGTVLTHDNLQLLHPQNCCSVAKGNTQADCEEHLNLMMNHLLPAVVLSRIAVCCGLHLCGSLNTTGSCNCGCSGLFDAWAIQHSS